MQIQLHENKILLHTTGEIAVHENCCCGCYGCILLWSAQWNCRQRKYVDWYHGDYIESDDEKIGYRTYPPYLHSTFNLSDWDKLMTYEGLLFKNGQWDYYNELEEPVGTDFHIMIEESVECPEETNNIILLKLKRPIDHADMIQIWPINDGKADWLCPSKMSFSGEKMLYSVTFDMPPIIVVPYVRGVCADWAKIEAEDVSVYPTYPSVERSSAPPTLVPPATTISDMRGSLVCGPVIWSKTSWWGAEWSQMDWNWRQEWSSFFKSYNPINGSCCMWYEGAPGFFPDSYAYPDWNYKCENWNSGYSNGCRETVMAGYAFHVPRGIHSVHQCINNTWVTTEYSIVSTIIYACNQIDIRYYHVGIWRYITSRRNGGDWYGTETTSVHGNPPVATMSGYTKNKTKSCPANAPVGGQLISYCPPDYSGGIIIKTEWKPLGVWGNC